MTNSTCSLSETLSRCLPRFGTLQMAVARHREADDKRLLKGAYKPATQQPPSASDLEVYAWREDVEFAREELVSCLSRAEHLVKALAQRPDLPAWSIDLPELLFRLQRLRGHVEACTTPWELEFPIDEAGQRQRGEHHEAHHRDIDELALWRQRISAYEDTRPAGQGPIVELEPSPAAGTGDAATTETPASAVPGWVPGWVAGVRGVAACYSIRDKGQRRRLRSVLYRWRPNHIDDWWKDKNPTRKGKYNYRAEALRTVVEALKRRDAKHTAEGRLRPSRVRLPSGKG